MSLLVDTGVWYAYVHEDDEHNEDAEAILAAAMEGRHGRILTTRDIVGETLTLLLARGAPKATVQEFAALVGLEEDPPHPQLSTVLDVQAALSLDAWELFQRHYEDSGLSFTDCTTVVAMRRKGIERIASFDEGFDGIVERVSAG